VQKLRASFVAAIDRTQVLAFCKLSIVQVFLSVSVEIGNLPGIIIF